MSRLRRANPEPSVPVSDDPLKARILASAPGWTSVPGGTAAGAPRRHPRHWVASSAVAAVALAAVLIISLSGRAPNVAQAFPILNGRSTLTPSELDRSLLYYGVTPGSDAIDIHDGHPVTTRWGTGYVLTNPRETAICVVAPGLRADDWGAACASRSRATTSGVFYEYAYDSALHSARLIGLFPAGTIVTTTTAGGTRHREKLNHGVLAINVTRPEQITMTTAHHTMINHLVPEDAHPAYGTASAPSRPASATVTGTPATPSP